MRAALQVSGAVRSAEPVHEQDDLARIMPLPILQGVAIGLVFMQHDLVAVSQRHLMARRPFDDRHLRQVAAGDPLGVAAAKQRVRAEAWKHVRP